MVLAATEKAKVCTSVRIKYLTVERSSPGRARWLRCAWCGAAPSADAAMLFDLGSSTLQLIVSESCGRSCRASGNLRRGIARRTIGYYLTTVKVLYVTLGHWAEDFLLFFLIFLANRFNSAYYPVLITGKCGPV